MILICPDTPPTPRTLGHAQPAALVSIFGQPLLEHFLVYFADKGVRAFDIIVSDRPQAVRQFVGRGEKWGVHITVHVWKKEPDLDQDFSKLREGATAFRVDRLPWMDASDDMGTEAWFKQCLQHPPPHSVFRPDYIEWKKDVFIGKLTPVVAGVDIKPPCFIGSKVRIGDRCSIGPNVMIEDDVYLDDGCEVRHSFVGSSTYIGPDLTLDRSMIMHDWVMDWSIGTEHRISDPLLLGTQHPTSPAHGTLGRLLALIALIIFSPTLLFAWLNSLVTRQPFLARKQAAATDSSRKESRHKTLTYSELPGVSGYWRRYPQLWAILQGQFRWVGNRPISPEQAQTLESEYEQMWLQTCYGFFSLADLHGVADTFSEDEKIHSSYYAATQNRKNDQRLLIQCLFRNKSHNTERS